MIVVGDGTRYIKTCGRQRGLIYRRMARQAAAYIRTYLRPCARRRRPALLSGGGAPALLGCFWQFRAGARAGLACEGSHLYIYGVALPAVRGSAEPNALVAGPGKWPHTLFVGVYAFVTPSPLRAIRFARFSLKAATTTMHS